LFAAFHHSEETTIWSCVGCTTPMISFLGSGVKENARSVGLLTLPIVR